MLIVELKELRGETGLAARYLRSKLGGPIGVKGSTLTISEAKPHEVKLLLNKFIHQRGLVNFRVVAPTIGLLEVHRFRERAEKYEPEGNPPPPSATMPYYFPSSGRGSTLFPAGKRTKRKS